MKTVTFFVIFLMVNFIYTQSIKLETFTTGLSNPVNIKHAGDDRLFLVELSGLIQIVNKDGTVNASPFLDIDEKVSDGGGERGLLAMAFHPDYSNNGFFYVNYIDNSGDTVISRFTRSTNDIADNTSELVLLQVSQPFANHNGGDLHFGTDGYLYISLGDGGSGGDPGNRSQTLTTLLGKILRIDVDNVSDGNNYAIPVDNPYVGISTALPEIWAYGLRNPFKFSFDSSNGSLWIADVGQNQIEEINRVDASSTGGENYGWKCFEGTSVFSTINDCGSINHTPPVEEYAHTANPQVRCSVTGGYVYRGNNFPNLQGLYFFGDFCSNEIGVIEETAIDNYELTFLNNFSIGGIAAFGEDNSGELYVTGVNSGNLFKIQDASLSSETNFDFEVEMYPNPSNSRLTFDFGNNQELKKIKIHIYDIQGKLISMHTNKGDKVFNIATESLKQGYYLVEITTASGLKLNKKLLIK